MNNSEATTCPSCGRYIGVVKTCKYCDCDVLDSSALKHLKTMSLLLGVGGLVMLVVMTMAHEIPRVRISRINPLMDYAVVLVEGSVDRKPYVRNAQGRGSCVSFVVSDGSGKLRVTAYRDVARKLIEQDAVPEMGSAIKVSGRISISKGGEPRLILSSPEGVVIREG